MSEWQAGPGLLDRIVSTEAMSACWDDRARLQGMLDFEAALVAAEADAGVVPQAAVGPIVACCRAELFDRQALSEAAGAAGNLAIPVVKALTALVGSTDADAARSVHWGATSQDAQDTGTVLQIGRALALLVVDLDRLRDGLRNLASEHAATVMIGRTWLQQALPITFGLKAAGWLAATGRTRSDLVIAGRAANALQFGGAVGTLASLGPDAGTRVAARLARRLSLELPPLPWHTDRTRIAALGAAIGIAIGAMGKIARDLALLSQTELAEVSEPASGGRGGSSTMPHKRNPVGCAIALSAALQAPALVATLLSAMVQEHERGLGGWHAEWEALPSLFRLGAAAITSMADTISGLEIDTERMSADLDVTKGLIMAEAVSMALAVEIGKSPAHRLVEHASRAAVAAGTSLRSALLADTEVSRHLDATRIDELLRPEHYLGASSQFIAAALEADSLLPRGTAERPSDVRSGR